jgi:hypothetical protein
MSGKPQTTRRQRLKNFGAGLAIIMTLPVTVPIIFVCAFFMLVERLETWAYSLKGDR